MAPLNQFLFASCLAVAGACGGEADRSVEPRSTGGGAQLAVGGAGGGSVRPGTGGVSTGGVGTGGTSIDGICGSCPRLESVSEDFEDSDPISAPGLWMGSVIGPPLPIEVPNVERPGGGLALHLVGTAGPDGVEFIWHTAFPVEANFQKAVFQARTDLPQGTRLRVTVGGVAMTYWQDIAAALPWPAAEFSLDGAWRSFEVDFDALGFGPNGVPSPHLQPTMPAFGALHFALPPNADYDLWLDNVVLVGRLPK